MTTSFLGALEKFCLAEAQECFWQRAVLEKYKNSLIAKLAGQVSSQSVSRKSLVDARCRKMQVSEYYEAALTAAAEGPNPTAHCFPAVSLFQGPEVYLMLISKLTDPGLDFPCHCQTLSLRGGRSISAEYGRLGEGQVRMNGVR